jgi:hypothetical protein
MELENIGGILKNIRKNDTLWKRRHEYTMNQSIVVRLPNTLMGDTRSTFKSINMASITGQSKDSMKTRQLMNLSGTHEVSPLRVMSDYHKSDDGDNNTTEKNKRWLNFKNQKTKVPSIRSKSQLESYASKI